MLRGGVSLPGVWLKGRAGAELYVSLYAQSPAYLQCIQASATFQPWRWWLLKTTFKDSRGGKMSVIQAQDITIPKSVLYSKALSRQKYPHLKRFIIYVCMYLFILLGGAAHQAVYGGSEDN